MKSQALLTSGSRLGTSCLAIIARRSYRFDNRSQATPLEEAPAIDSEAAFELSSNEGAGSRMVEEAHAEAYGKPLTDVLLRGSAHAPSPVSSLDTALQIGAARKAVRVHGNRRIVVKPSGNICFSAPEPFQTLELTWDHAYGGRDAHAEALMFGAPDSPLAGRGEMDLSGVMRVAYIRNGAGRGYWLDVDRKRLHGELAPNLEDPTDPVTADRLLNQRTTDWMDRPIAACYEPIDPLTFPRVQFVIPPAHDAPARRVHELGTGALLAEDLNRRFDLNHPIVNPRLYNCAPSGLAVTRLAGDERVRLWGLHRAHAFLEFDLPADPPRMALELPGVGHRDLLPELQTVLVEPELDRVTLTWAGRIDVAMPYPEQMLRDMPRRVTWKRGLSS